MKFLLIAILGHMLGDFVFQTNRIAEIKNCSKSEYEDYKAKYNKVKFFQPREKFLWEKIILIFGHVLTHALLTYSIYCLSKNILNNSFEINIRYFILGMVISHFVVDFFKNKLEEPLNRATSKGKVILFVGDQLIHLIIIYTLIIFCSPKTTPYLNLFKLSFWKALPNMSFENRMYMFFILIILNTYAASFFIAIVLKLIKNDDKNHIKDQCVGDVISSSTPKTAPIPNVGALIGILERILISLFVWKGISEAITIVIAIKALARFKEMDDKNFAEFYLIGSLLSLMFAITTGLLLRYLF